MRATEFILEFDPGESVLGSFKVYYEDYLLKVDYFFKSLT